jgi:hypothetical protein
MREGETRFLLSRRVDACTYFAAERELRRFALSVCTSQKRDDENAIAALTDGVKPVIRQL